MKRFYFLCAIIILCVPLIFSQNSTPDRAQIVPPPHRVEPPSPTATAAELEARGDELRAEKYFPDALEYYKAALVKTEHPGMIYNKMGVAKLFLQHFHDAEKDFERAIHSDRQFADAYNNLGVIRYEQRRYGPAIKEYKKAIKIAPDSASYYSNLGSAYFAKRDWNEANAAYSKAIQLDPDVFGRSFRAGISAQMSSPDDQAKFEFVLAKIYAKSGNFDQALQCLRRSMEGGYKNINDVYKDDEFAILRKDPRFAQLMANRPTALPE